MASFEADTGLELTIVTLLYEQLDGSKPDAATAARWVEGAGDTALPVLVDPTRNILFGSLPVWEGYTPVLCSVDPRMRIVMCKSGHGLDPHFEAIREHAGL